MITVIVPIYNTPQRMLEKCIDSIISQSIVDWELLLIDDGSNQECANLCDILSQKDSRIKVMHISNKGVSNARNVGINHAAGEYVCFIDSDDWIKPNYFEVLLDHKEKADIVAVSIMKYMENSQKEMPMYEVDKDIYSDNRSELIRSVLGDFPAYDGMSLNAVWGKLYSMKTIRKFNIYFHSELKRLEDCIFNLELLLHGVTSVYLSKEKCYFYRVSNESTMGRFNENLVDNILEATECFYSSLKQKNVFDYYQQSYGMRVFKNTMIVVHDYYFNKCNKIKDKRKILFNYLNSDFVRVGFLSCKNDSIGTTGNLFLELLRKKYYRMFILLYTIKHCIKRGLMSVGNCKLNQLA